MSSACSDAKVSPLEFGARNPVSTARAVTAFLHGAAALSLALLAGAAGAADDGQWTLPGKDLAATRYSTLDEINAGNVG